MLIRMCKGSGRAETCTNCSSMRHSNAFRPMNPTNCAPGKKVGASVLYKVSCRLPLIAHMHARGHLAVFGDASLLHAHLDCQDSIIEPKAYQTPPGCDCSVAARSKSLAQVNCLRTAPCEIANIASDIALHALLYSSREFCMLQHQPHRSFSSRGIAAAHRRSPWCV